MPLRSKIGFSIVLLLYIGTFISYYFALMQIGNRVIVAYHSIFLYIGIGILLFIEKDHLEDFCVDRFALVILIMSTVFRSRVGVDNASFFYLYTW